MSLRNSKKAYGGVAKFFHWAIFILMLGMMAFGYLMGNIPDSYRGVAYNTHKLIGLLILSLMVLRAWWALINIKPQSAHVTFLGRFSERTVHLFLYAFIIAMPLAGWIGSSAAGRAPHLGEIMLSLPIDKNKALVEQAFNVHANLALIIIFLVNLHILAVLYHFFIKKERTLRRMMPNG